MKRVLSVLVGLLAVSTATMTPRAYGAGSHGSDVRERHRNPSCTRNARRAIVPAKWRRCRCSHSKTRGRGRRPSRPRWSRARCRRGADHENSLKMRNDRSLSERQIQTIAAWVDAGAPRVVTRPTCPRFRNSRRAGLTGRNRTWSLEMPLEFKVPAEGELSVVNFYSKVPLRRRPLRAGRRAASGQPFRRAPRGDLTSSICLKARRSTK